MEKFYVTIKGDDVQPNVNSRIQKIHLNLSSQQFVSLEVKESKETVDDLDGEVQLIKPYVLRLGFVDHSGSVSCVTMNDSELSTLGRMIQQVGERVPWK